MPYPRKIKSFINKESARAWAAHGLALAGCGILAAAVFSLSALGNPPHSWVDPVNYLATAKQMVLHDSFLPRPPDYSMLALAAAHDAPVSLAGYPNIGYELLLGFWCLITGRFSLMNGIYISGLFTVLSALAVYGLSHYILRDKVSAVLVTAGLLLHREIDKISSQPMTDTGLLFFFILSVWGMIGGRILLSGLALALGYFYREHALIFWPLLPLLSPQCVSVRSYLRITLVTGLVLICGLSAAFLAKYHFMHGQMGSDSYSGYDFYLKPFLNMLGDNFFNGGLHTLYLFLKNCMFFIARIGVGFPLAGLFLYFAGARGDKLTMRLLAVSLGVSGAPLVLYITDYITVVPSRYYIYAIPLLLLVMVLLLRRRYPRPHPRLAVAVLVAFLVLCRPLGLTKEGLEALTQPAGAFARLQSLVDAPFTTLSAILPKRGAVVLSNYGSYYFDSFVYVAVEDPVIVRLPDFEAFRRGSDNALLDGIVLSQLDGLVSSQAGEAWNSSPVITDLAGVSFERTDWRTPFRDTPTPQHYVLTRVRPRPVE